MSLLESLLLNDSRDFAKATLFGKTGPPPRGSISFSREEIIVFSLEFYNRCVCRPVYTYILTYIYINIMSLPSWPCE